MSDRLAARPGFLLGFAQVFRAIAFAARTPASWPLVFVPAAVFAAIATAAAVGGMTWLLPWVASWFPQSGGAWWVSALEWGARLVLLLTSLVVGTWVALLLTPPLSGPALERLVGMQERELLLPERPSPGFFRELWVGFKAQAVALCFGIPAMAALWALELVFPPLAVLTVPLKVLVTALVLAWNLFDYPLTLHGIPASQRLGFVAANAGAVLGFGVAFSALFWVPCFGILMLPIGVVAATRLLHRLAESDPLALPQLPRAQPAALPQPGVLHPEHWPQSRVSSEVGGNSGD